MSHRPDHVGTGDEHVAGLVHHENEVGDGGGIDGPSRTGAQNGGNLRNDAAGQGVAEEDLGVTRQADHALLDPGAAAVVEADDRRPHLRGQIHDLADLGRVGLRQAAAEDGEVLRKDVDQPAVDPAMAGDHAVSRDAALLHGEIGATMDDELVQFLERALVQKQGEPFPGGQLSRIVLALDSSRIVTLFGLPVSPSKLLKLFPGVHGGRRFRGHLPCFRNFRPESCAGSSRPGTFPGRCRSRDAS